MKQITITVFVLCSSISLLFTQNVAINTSGAVANASSVLDVSSTTQGLLVPRMTTAQRNAIGAPATSLLVFDNTLGAFYFYDGAAWRPLLANNTGWTTVGNNGTVNGTNFLGSIDNVSIDIRTNNVIRATFMNTGELRIVGGGTEASPVYAWTGDPNTGMYSIGADVLGITTGGVERFRMGTAEAVINELGNNYDFRVEGDVNPNVFNVDASIDVVGFSAMPSAPYELGAGIPVHTMAYPFEVGSDGNGGMQIAIAYYRATDPTLNPEQNGGWGYVGYNAGGPGNDQYWWRGYSGGWINVSERRLKRDIQPINEDMALESYVMNTIRNMKPSFYNYKNELDNMEPGLENHYRPAYRMGLIADESPDYILDESFSGVDIYGLATMSLVGVQHNMKEIDKLKSAINIQDFGSQNLSGIETWVPFTENFNGITPVVTLTSNNANVVLSITEKNDRGFKVVASKSVDNVSFDWIAMAKVKDYSNQETELPSNIKDKLEIPTNTKTKILDFYSTFQSTIDSQGQKGNK